MIDPTPQEQEAINRAGELAGEYLESIGKTDLAKLEVDEWQTFLEAVVTGYTDRLRELTKDQVPF